MRVEKIELIGFKSFGDRTIFNFHPGMTCIVGPNGSGKSNVVDSFKWVLGEQSAKSLRGDSMQEVIFNGSNTKKPKGMAEVTLHVSGLGGNGDGTLTTVTRRLYRSGDSDYMLNRDECRLKDIRDLFLDTGLEIKSYSILEQDRISAILNSKPEERRFLIEEVAGVMKYKVRRTEAQSKLESSKQNLERINDITAEVKRQINSLDRQVKKAERYRKLMEELRLIELKTAKAEFEALGLSLAAVMAELETLREEEALKRAEVGAKENEIESGRIIILEREKALESVDSELRGIEREMGDLERAIAVLHTEKDNLNESAIKLALQQEENTRKIDEASRRSDEISASRVSLAAEIAALKDAVGEKLESLTLGEDEIAGKEAVLEALRRDAFDVSEEISRIRNEHFKYGSTLDGLLKKEEALEVEAAGLDAYLKETDLRLKETDSAVHALQNDLRLKAEEKEVLIGDIASRAEKLESLKASLASGREELASSVSRLDSLGELGAAVLSSEAVAAFKEIGLLASVSDVIEVPEEYERAVECALRESVNGFIMPNYQKISLAVESLKAGGFGKAAFVPLAAPPRQNNTLPEGAIAWAADLIKTKDGYNEAISSLLCNIAVFKDLPSALAGATGLPATGPRVNGAVSVTLSGEVVEPTGAVIAGRGKEILPIKRQMRELEVQTAEKRALLEAQQQEMTKAAEEIDGKGAILKAVEEASVEGEKEAAGLRHQAERHAEEAGRTAKKLSFIRLEREEMEKEKDALKGLQKGKAIELDALEQKRILTGDSIKALQEGLSAKREAFEAERSESFDLRLSLNSMKEKLVALQKEEASLSTLIYELREKTTLLSKEAAQTESKIKERADELALKDSALRHAALGADGLKRTIAVERESIGSASEAVGLVEKGLKETRTAVEETTKRIAELDVQRTEYSINMGNLADNMKNLYGVELSAQEFEPLTDEDREYHPELKRKIEELGPVSLGSIEEYEELRKRHEFLAVQKEDLERSIAELEEAIRKINGTTRKRLREAYDALNAKCGEVFTRLFGGGRAELVLTDETNILETGIDIVAQPPGKRLQNINLLSGGEKTLTALALLFSCFLIKPTPLCILDEADAALDESNTGKFAEMLKDLSRNIQFIVVTHNRVTMEAADYIYGITMEDPGNSKVISMELSEAPAPQ